MTKSKTPQQDKDKAETLEEFINVNYPDLIPPEEFAKIVAQATIDFMRPEFDIVPSPGIEFKAEVFEKEWERKRKRWLGEK